MKNAVRPALMVVVHAARALQGAASDIVGAATDRAILGLRAMRQISHAVGEQLSKICSMIRRAGSRAAGWMLATVWDVLAVAHRAWVPLVEAGHSVVQQARALFEGITATLGVVSDAIDRAWCSAMRSLATCWRSVCGAAQQIIDQIEHVHTAVLVVFDTGLSHVWLRALLPVWSQPVSLVEAVKPPLDKRAHQIYQTALDAYTVGARRPFQAYCAIKWAGQWIRAAAWATALQLWGVLSPQLRWLRQHTLWLADQVLQVLREIHLYEHVAGVTSYMLALFGESCTRAWCITCGLLLWTRSGALGWQWAIMLKYTRMPGYSQTAACCIVVGLMLFGRTCRRYLPTSLSAIGERIEAIGELVILHIDFGLIDAAVWVGRKAGEAILRMLQAMVSVLASISSLVAFVGRCCWEYLVGPVIHSLTHVWSNPIMWWVASGCGLWAIYRVHTGEVGMVGFESMGSTVWTSTLAVLGLVMAHPVTQTDVMYARNLGLISVAPANALVELALDRPLSMLVSPTFASLCATAFGVAAHMTRRMDCELSLSVVEKRTLSIRLGRSVVRTLFSVATVLGVVLRLDWWATNAVLRAAGFPAAVIYTCLAFWSTWVEIATWWTTNVLLRNLRDTPLGQGPARVKVAAAVAAAPVAPAQIFDTPECCICLSEYDNRENVSVLRCGHVFHTECTAEWLAQSRRPVRSAASGSTERAYSAKKVFRGWRGAGF